MIAQATVLPEENQQEAELSTFNIGLIPDTMLSLRRRRIPKMRFYVVSFADGTGLRIDRNVVARNARDARRRAEVTVPAALYGPDLVFLKAKVNKNLSLTIDSECIRLLTEKTGVPL